MSLFSQHAALHSNKVYPDYQQRSDIKHKYNAATASCNTVTTITDIGISHRGIWLKFVWLVVALVGCWTGDAGWEYSTAQLCVPYKQATRKEATVCPAYLPTAHVLDVFFVTSLAQRIKESPAFKVQIVRLLHRILNHWVQSIFYH